MYFSDRFGNFVLKFGNVALKHELGFFLLCQLCDITRGVCQLYECHLLPLYSEILRAQGISMPQV